MSERAQQRPGPCLVDRLDEHLGAFLETLVELRYRTRTQLGKQRSLDRFIRWMRDTGLTTFVLDESHVDAYLQDVVCRPYRRGSPERATLHQFLQHLREAGATAPRTNPPVASADALVERYIDYLRSGRGLSERSIAVYSPFVRAFVVAQQLGEDDDLDTALDAGVVRGHLLDRARGRSSEYTRLLATALRSFLRFLFLHGGLTVDLSTAIPPVRRWQLASVPPFLSSEEVERVLATIDRTTARGRRGLAILLLLARLGLRPGEVAALELDDVRWSVGEIVVRGKGGFHDRLPLPHDVGEALALYLRRDRGSSPSRHVFLRMRAPRVGLSGPCAISAVARDAIHRAGLRPRGRVGAHIFRHSLATRMIRQGASLAEIAQVLRHRCLHTTQIYAKVDLETLQGVARPWPLAGAGR
jgi:integrase/recombinase XerD